MQTTFKYISFIPQMTDTKTHVWNCINNNSKSVLGVVKWYPPFRKYSFFTVNEEAVFSEDCLKDIWMFVRSANFNHWSKRKDEQ